MSVEKSTVRVGGIASKAWRIYRTNVNTMLLLAAIMIVPAYIVLAVLIGVAAPEGFFDIAFDQAQGEDLETVSWDGGDVTALVAAGVVGGIVALIATLLATGACFKVIQEVYADRAPDWRASLAAARARLASLMWLAIISGFLLILAFLALVIPGIYLWVAWAVAVPVLMTEERRGIEALSRSRALVKGTWWPAFGVLLIGLIASWVVGLVIGTIFRAGADNPSLGEGLTMGTLQEIVTQIIVVPFLAALSGVLYFELRQRNASST
ncbi:MAG: hypothetical protein M3277_03000 [Actinomycetota bacterium]|nr:hypothetical protein [Actinomycetota bacterium]